jgi:hypothetical protein
MRLAVLGAIMSATTALACGSSTTSPSSAPTPTLPSPAAPASPGTASIIGTLNSAGSTAMSARAATVGVTVNVAGTGIGATVTPGGSFTLTGVPSGDVVLQFTGQGIDARASITGVEDQEEIHIVVSVNGSQAVVNVTDRKKPQHGTELEGLITLINAATRTLVVNGTTVTVPTSAIIRHGDQQIAFADLKIGQRVHVKGTPSGPTVVASEVKLQDENPSGGAEAEVEGKVSMLSGSCPLVTFTIKTTKVITTATTQFTGGLCSQLTNSVSAEVTGVRNPDGSITATRVTAERNDN